MSILLTRRLIQLFAGLVLFGVGCAVMINAGIGLDPWVVLAEGLSRKTGVGIGWITNIVGFLVLLLWIPLRQRPGLGTVLNILIIGTVIQITLPFVPRPDHFAVQLLMFLGGTVLVGVASGLYIGSRFGPGPRDGLMTGISQRYGTPVWGARTAVEISVLVLGWALGGTVGLGTILFALLIGPLCQFFLRRLDTAPARGKSVPPIEEMDPKAQSVGPAGGS